MRNNSAPQSHTARFQARQKLMTRQGRFDLSSLQSNTLPELTKLFGISNLPKTFVEDITPFVNTLEEMQQKEIPQQDRMFYKLIETLTLYYDKIQKGTGNDKT